jgi:molybdopterin/thiamine biosynthesis adenylyltransferase
MQGRDDDPFDRQKRIGWWRQEVAERTRVFVIGAGAIGNEVIKNLMLLGFRDVLIWDFDRIEASNLSRTVLFRGEDLGQSKARVAAERARAMALHPDPRIEWCEGDVVWDLGLGLLRTADLVFGCLDNTEARMAINRACRAAGVPWIDGRIGELDCQISVYLPGEGGCYECGMSEADHHDARRRYSCDNVMRVATEESRIPTVGIAAAWCAAVQVQEGIKVLHGRTEMDARTIVYRGSINRLDVYSLPGACQPPRAGPPRAVERGDAATAAGGGEQPGPLGAGRSARSARRPRLRGRGGLPPLRPGAADHAAAAPPLRAGPALPGVDVRRGWRGRTARGGRAHQHGDARALRAGRRAGDAARPHTSCRWPTPTASMPTTSCALVPGSRVPAVDADAGAARQPRAPGRGPAWQGITEEVTHVVQRGDTLPRIAPIPDRSGPARRL